MTKLRNRLLVTICIATLTAAVAAFSQGNTDDPGGTTAPEVEGSWRVIVTPIGAPIPPFLTFSSYGRGGAFLESAQPGQGPGHGTWRRTANREFGVTFEKLVFGPDGSFAGTLKVREVIRLSANGDSYAGDATAEVFDPSGSLVASFCATTQGTRITVEAPSCP